MKIRPLTADDAQIYQAVRLRSLQEHPEAFGRSFEEDAALPIEEVAQQLSTVHTLTLGAFDAETLVGIVGMSRYQRRKTWHKAMLGNTYVVPQARGQGTGKALLAAMIERARASAGLEDLTLAVTVGNPAARAVYIGAGFVPFGIEPRYIKVDDRYYDIEWMILHLD